MRTLFSILLVLSFVSPCFAGMYYQPSVDGLTYTMWSSSTVMTKADLIAKRDLLIADITRVQQLKNNLSLHDLELIRELLNVYREGGLTAQDRVDIVIQEKNDRLADIPEITQ